MMPRQLVSVSLSMIAALLLAGCMPASYTIDGGAHPENVDKNVRFRTTYYFRVFGDCYASQDANGELPEYGGLYRFRMTGKANSLTNKVRFESGTLPAKNIDPFGVSLRYDKDSDSLLFRDAALEDKARIAKDFLTVAERLKALQTQMTPPAAAPGTSTPAVLDPAIALAFNKAIAAVIERTEALIKSESSTPVTADLDRLVKAHQSLIDIYKQYALNDPQKKIFEDAALQRMNAALASVVALATNLAQGRACANNQRGFLILGPEGWRQFDPEERLVLAMYSSGRPLISTMNELSARAINIDANGPETALVFSTEHANIEKSKSELDDFDSDKPEDGPEAIMKAIAALAPAKTN